MKHSNERSWLRFGFGLGVPLLFGMSSCESDSGGLTLPLAGRDGSGAHAGSAGESGMSGMSGEGGESGQAGQHDMGGTAGKATNPATGGSSTGKGGSNGKGGSKSSHAGSDSGGSQSQAGTGGSIEDAGSGGTSDAGMGGEDGNAAGANGLAGGTGGSSGMGGSGGTDASGAGGTAGLDGSGGLAGSAGSGTLASCIFHSAPELPSGGEGGAAPAPKGVAVANNAFVGPYLTDLAGLALYIYGADLPGDCNNPPVSNCIDDCVQSWPIFDAGERTLPVTLDDAVFGTIERTDGKFQTTYYGWPLYYYKTDTASGMITGQGKAKTWFAAEVSLPNLMIMRGSVAGGGIKYLGDEHGHTLYSLSVDTLGGSGSLPVSGCTGTCLDTFAPFAPGAVYPVTTIEPHDVALFFREDGSLQTAYKGAPLYYAKDDERAGEQNGLTLFGGALVLP